MMDKDGRMEGFVSFDVESDGNNPMQHSMLSIGMVLLSEECTANKNYTIVSTFYDTIQARAECQPDPNCLKEFWNHHPEEWKHVNEDPKPANIVMKSVADWLQHQSVRYNLKICGRAMQCGLDVLQVLLREVWSGEKVRHWFFLPRLDVVKTWIHADASHPGQTCQAQLFVRNI